MGLYSAKNKVFMARILLVEDSKFQQIATGRALQRVGHTLFSAGDGDAALLIARKETPDLILLDMMLPKRSGEDVLKALKADPATKSIPVIVLTGLSQKNANRLVADGATSFFEKSLMHQEKGEDQLRLAIDRVLKNSRPAS